MIIIDMLTRRRTTIKVSKADVILHPIRMRIIQALLGERKLTASQLTKLISDTPQATMYRHLKILVESNIIFIAEQNQIRGTFEKKYALSENGGQLSHEDMKEVNREYHKQYFMNFVATVMSDFGRYMDGEEVDPPRDGFSYIQSALNFSGEELIEFNKSFFSLLQKAKENKPTEERNRRIITIISIPEGMKVNE
jgi:DNA-binding transcriptional ArsR family regulator